MSNPHAYTVPNYYANFSCKGPDCRNTCCTGWGITISLSEYFHLLGLSCSKDLRQRLDCAFHIADNPDEARYAILSPRYDGDCRLHREDGYCALHRECGEEALSAICRYYPRGAKSEYAFECSCANSCEATLEHLFKQQEPITFTQASLCFEIPEAEPCKNPLIRKYYADIRRYVISILQNRDYRLKDRLFSLGRAMERLSRAFEATDEAAIALSLDEVYESLPAYDPDDGLAMQEALITFFEENSPSLRRYSACLHEFFGHTERYREAARHFEDAFPDWERLFEQMLVNHIFFECFPFGDKQENIYDEYAALSAVYALLRYMAVGYMSDKNGVDSLVDVCAATFRLIEHTRFDHNAVVLLHRAGCFELSELAHLIGK